MLQINLQHHIPFSLHDKYSKININLPVFNDKVCVTEFPIYRVILIPLYTDYDVFFRGLSSEQQGAFRESYGMLGQLRAYTKAPMVCLSATAPDDVIQSVATSLNLITPNIIRVDVNKANIT